MLFFRQEQKRIATGIYAQKASQKAVHRTDRNIKGYYANGFIYDNNHRMIGHYNNGFVKLNPEAGPSK